MITVIHVYGWSGDTAGPGLAVHATARTAEAAAALADAAATGFGTTQWQGRRKPQRWVSLTLAPGALWPAVDDRAAVLYVDERAPGVVPTSNARA